MKVMMLIENNFENDTNYIYKNVVTTFW